MISAYIIKIFLPTLVSFFLGIIIASPLISFLRKHELWKKKGVALGLDGNAAPISHALHNDEKKQTPRMGGIVIWASVLATSLIFWFLGRYGEGLSSFDFISRSQTWLPLVAMLGGAIIGLVDDYAVTGGLGSYVGGGLSLKTRILGVALIGLFVGYWFYEKLGSTGIDIPFYGFLHLGVFIIPVIIVTMVAVFSGGIIDGIDGLSGGIMTFVFGAYGIIAILNHQFDIATFCFVTSGAILSFLWFNIPPAKFYMSETGMLALTTSLTVVAFLTKAAPLLLVIAFPLFTASGSAIIQILSKKLRKGKKVFVVAPLHNHFQAKGVPGYAVTMHYWMVSFICAITGVILYIAGK
jgi:phospho-N-acetylmuramoyl-pentapeptide-transferase